MLKRIILLLATVSFFAQSADSEVVTKVAIADRRVPPVMVYVDSTPSFTSEMIDIVSVRLEKYAEYCVEYADYWFCNGEALYNAKGFRGWDGDGNNLPIGYLCDNTARQIPTKAYYSVNYFYGICVQVEFENEGLEAYATFPYEDEDEDC